MNYIWMEDWTSNPFSRSKFLKGKIIYQRDLEAMVFVARQYRILDGEVSFWDHEEDPFSTLLSNSDNIKELWE